MSYKGPTQDEIHVAWVTTSEALIRRIQKLESALEELARFGSSDGCQCFRVARKALREEK